MDNTPSKNIRLEKWLLLHKTAEVAKAHVMQNPNQNKINRLFNISQISKFVFFSVFVFILFTNIKHVEASALSDTLFKIKDLLKINNAAAAELKINDTKDGTPNVNIDDFVLRSNTRNIVDKNSTDARSNIFKDGEVLHSAVGPVRSMTDSELINTDNLQVYEVKAGDTLEDVARLYDVSNNTIVWANGIKNKRLTVGDTLIILPISGVQHKIKKGDTIKSIARKYKADESEILEFNNIRSDELVTGEELIIPDGEIYFDGPIKKDNPNKKPIKRKVYASAGIGYYVRPIIGGAKTQGIHGHNGIDIGAPIGTPLLAAAAGTVQVAKQGGYNGGYGSMVIISHANGTQTVYGHMSNVYVSTGQSVSQGENIGLSGNSGKSTGPHLHFEVRGAENPF